MISKTHKLACNLTLALGFFAWCSAASATSLFLGEHDGFSVTNSTSNSVSLFSGFQSGDTWEGEINILATEPTAAVLYGIAFELNATPETTIDVYSDSQGYLDTIVAGASQIQIALLLTGNPIADLLTFVVTNSGTSPWALTVGIQAVPLPAAAWLFLSALSGLIIIGRRRQQLTSS